MRFGFVTCVELGLSCIEEIYAAGGQLDLIITLHDHKSVSKSGRVYLDDFAKRNRVPLLKVSHINDDDSLAAIRGANLDWLFVIGWSQIASQEVLNSTKNGVLGMHPTLLPQGRGRAAIPWTIIKDLDTAGVTMFALDEGVDTGPIVDQVEISVADDETATTLYSKVNDAHRTLMRKSWPQLAAGTYSLTTQDESRATEWPGRSPKDGQILPEMSVNEVERLVRATAHPYPGAYWDEPHRRARVWAGTTTYTEVANLEIPLVDGTYWATEVIWETPPPGEN